MIYRVWINVFHSKKRTTNLKCHQIIYGGKKLCSITNSMTKNNNNTIQNTNTITTVGIILKYYNNTIQ